MCMEDDLPAGPGPALTTLMQEIVEAPGAPQVTMVKVELEPGSPGSPPHRHPGPMFGYMLEGEILFELDGQPPERYRAGQSFWEPGGDVVHLKAANASEDEPASFIAIVVGEQGQPPVLPLAG